MTDFTKGNWYREDDFVFSDNGLRIADLSCDGQEEMSETEIAANGDLIAAAPMMFEALTRLFDAGYIGDCFSETEAFCRAAIAKAKGDVT